MGGKGTLFSHMRAYLLNKVGNFVNKKRHFAENSVFFSPQNSKYNEIITIFAPSVIRNEEVFI